jgi:hypothetical protein
LALSEHSEFVKFRTSVRGYRAEVQRRAFFFLVLFHFGGTKKKKNRPGQVCGLTFSCDQEKVTKRSPGGAPADVHSQLICYKSIGNYLPIALSMPNAADRPHTPAGHFGKQKDRLGFFQPSVNINPLPLRGRGLGVRSPRQGRSPISPLYSHP